MPGAQGPTVKLTFAGDASSADKAFQKVGDGAERMGKRIEDSSKKVSGVKGSFDAAGEGADASEQKFQGVADITSGIVDGFQGITDGSLSMSERLQLLGGAGADLAGGFAALLPLLGTMASGVWGAVTATWSFTAALLANPITWIVIGIIALIAAIVLMITHWDKVKEVFTTVVNWIGDRLAWVKDRIVDAAKWIGQRFADAWNWVKDTAVGVWNWFADLPNKIGRVFGAIKDGIVNAFKSAFNFVADIWNNTIGRISINIPSWVPIIGGKSFSAPRIPKFHTGGVVPGAPGSEMLAILQAGERVIPATGPQSGGAVAVTFSGDTSSAFATAFMNLVRGGQIQIGAA